MNKSKLLRRQAATTPVPPPEGFKPWYTSLPEGDQPGAPSRGVPDFTWSDKFLNWFDGSKVVDSENNPMPVYHGTSSDTKSFISRGNGPYAQLGHWYDASPDSVHGYALGGNKQHASNIIPVYLSIKNPKYYPDIEHLKDTANGKYGINIKARVQKLRKDLKAEGYDGVCVRNSVATNGVVPDYWVAFSENQVKSAIGNSGEFNPDSRNIIASKTADSKLSDWVLGYARDHKDDVFISDKEVPETFRDLRPANGEVDPGYFLVPALLSGSNEGQTNSVIQSNVRLFLKRYGQDEGLFQIHGDKKSFALAIRISSISAAMLDDLAALDNYPAADDEDASKVQHERIDEAWDDWARYDFLRALEVRFPDKVDQLDEDQTRELFDRVRRRTGVEWIEDSSSLYIDVDLIAEAVNEADLDGPTVVKAENEEILEP